MNIRPLKNSLVFACCVFLVAGCRDNDDAMPDPNAAATPAQDAASIDPVPDPVPASPVAGDMSATLGEKTALATLNVVNEHEIATGRQALSKGVSGDVAAFAEMMVQAHSDNRAKTTALQPGSPDEQGQALQAKGEAELAELAKLEGNAYSKAYVDAMVKGHEEALALLDDKLIPAASSENARAHLTETRASVAEHLQRAKALQAQSNP